MTNGSKLQAPHKSRCSNWSSSCKTSPVNSGKFNPAVLLINSRCYRFLCCNRNVISLFPRSKDMLQSVIFKWIKFPLWIVSSIDIRSFTMQLEHWMRVRVFNAEKYNLESGSKLNLNEQLSTTTDAKWDLIIAWIISASFTPIARFRICSSEQCSDKRNKPYKVSLLMLAIKSLPTSTALSLSMWTGRFPFWMRSIILSLVSPCLASIDSPLLPQKTYLLANSDFGQCKITCKEHTRCGN